MDGRHPQLPGLRAPTPNFVRIIGQLTTTGEGKIPAAATRSRHDPLTALGEVSAQSSCGLDRIDGVDENPCSELETGVLLESRADVDVPVIVRLTARGTRVDDHVVGRVSQLAVQAREAVAQCGSHRLELGPGVLEPGPVPAGSEQELISRRRPPRAPQQRVPSGNVE